MEYNWNAAVQDVSYDLFQAATGRPEGTSRLWVKGGHGVDVYIQYIYI
jgi:hypothetical protein